MTLTARLPQFWWAWLLRRQVVFYPPLDLTDLTISGNASPMVLGHGFDCTKVSWRSSSIYHVGPADVYLRFWKTLFICRKKKNQFVFIKATSCQTKCGVWGIVFIWFKKFFFQFFCHYEMYTEILVSRQNVRKYVPHNPKSLHNSSIAK